MKIRVEPFVDGFIKSLKGRMESLDYEFFKLVFKDHAPSKFASKEELNPAKPAHYFRFGENHLNVLLPVWLLNGGTSNKSDRFRIACTEDHSFVIDTKEAILYDPSTEMMHKSIEQKAFWLAADWRDEARMKFADELQEKRLKILTLTERAEHIPVFYRNFVAFVTSRKLKTKFPTLRYGLNPVAEAAPDLIEIALNELIERANSKAA